MKYLNYFIFLISFLGLCLFFHKRFKIHICFTPIIVISSVIFLLFIGGLIVPLNMIAYLLLVLGVISFIRLFIHYKENINSIIYLLIFTFILFITFIRFRGISLVAYDDFSHWGTVVKNMLFVDRMPNSHDQLIEFQSYQLGTSLWIYYVSRVTNNTESIYLFAQSIILISCLFSFFSIAKKLEHYIILLIFSVFSLVINVKITTLSVDTVISLYALSYFIFFIHMNRDQYIISIPFVTALTQIKASCIFFVMLTVLFCYLKRNIKEQKFKLLYCLIPAILSIILWRVHLLFVFPGASMTKHAVSLNYFKNIFSSKTYDDILQISKASLNKLFAFNFSNKFNFYFVVIIVLILYFSNIKNREKNIIFILISYFSYMFFLYMMFIFSMPHPADFLLQGFERYAYTIFIFVLGYFIIMLILNNCASKYVYLLSITFILMLSYDNDYSSLYSKNQDGFIRLNFRDEVIKEEVEPGRKYLIIDDGNNEISRYDHFSIAYDLWSRDIEFCTTNEFLNRYMFEWHKEYDYLIINTPNLETNYFLQQNGYTQYIDKQFAIIKSSA